MKAADSTPEYIRQLERALLEMIESVENLDYCCCSEERELINKPCGSNRCPYCKA